MLNWFRRLIKLITCRFTEFLIARVLLLEIQIKKQIFRRKTKQSKYSFYITYNSTILCCLSCNKKKFFSSTKLVLINPSTIFSLWFSTDKSMNFRHFAMICSKLFQNTHSLVSKLNRQELRAREKGTDRTKTSGNQWSGGPVCEGG